MWQFQSQECVDTERTLDEFLWRKQLVHCDSHPHGEGLRLFSQLKPGVKSFNRTTRRTVYVLWGHKALCLTQERDNETDLRHGQKNRGGHQEQPEASEFVRAG